MTPAERYKRKVAPDRNAWRNLWQRCMVCGKQKPLQVHEIEHKSQASLSWGVRPNYLAACVNCHVPKLHNDAEWPHARQLALKLVRDPAHFDLQTWLAIKPRVPTYVTMDEISQWIRARRIA